MYAARSAVGEGYLGCREQDLPECIDRADLGFWCPLAHGNAHAGTAEVDARPGSKLAAPHKVVCHFRRENGDIELVTGLDPALEAGGKIVVDHEPVAGRAFECGGKLSENCARRRAAENHDLGGLRGTALLRRSRYNSSCSGRRC